MYTRKCKKFKGEIETYLAKEKNIFESRIDRVFRMLNIKTTLNQANIRKKDGYHASQLLFILSLLPLLKLPTVHSFCIKKWYHWCAARKDAFYRKFLQPVIDVYRRLGIEAQYKPINDVIVGTRKISGTGAAEIGDCIVFVGNLILDFNYDMMCRILKVPDEKFRDKVHKTLLENLSTIRRELGEEEALKWDETTLNAMMAEAFQKLLGPMEPRKKDAALDAKMEELGVKMLP